ncbi:tetratricopeptide repeat protein [Lentisalinibacter orientalis]|uniref:tetratricopeptide repeat protein n=1 Tax=Lentisalinibacter orientalis TaxID=2992241 RepID=UPI00386B6536
MSKLHRPLSALLVLILAGCAATAPEPRPGARIEIQEAVGFTITEEARIGAAVREDYQTALDLLENEREEQGIELLRQVAEEAPSLSAPRIDLGIAYHRMGELKAAETELLAARALNPEHPIVHNELGIVYRKTGRFDEARRSYETALEIYPGFHYARRNLAILCDLYLADPECALANYEAYMKTVTADEEAALWIADIRNRLGETTP